MQNGTRIGAQGQTRVPAQEAGPLDAAIVARARRVVMCLGPGLRPCPTLLQEAGPAGAGVGHPPVVTGRVAVGRSGRPSAAALGHGARLNERRVPGPEAEGLRQRARAQDIPGAPDTGLVATTGARPPLAAIQTGLVAPSAAAKAPVPAAVPTPLVLPQIPAIRKPRSKARQKEAAPPTVATVVVPGLPRTSTRATEEAPYAGAGPTRAIPTPQNSLLPLHRG